MHWRQVSATSATDIEMNTHDENCTTADSQRPKPTHYGYVETPKGKVNEDWVYRDSNHWVNQQGQMYNAASGNMTDQPGYAWRLLDLSSLKELTPERIADQQNSLNSFYKSMEESERNFPEIS